MPSEPSELEGLMTPATLFELEGLARVVPAYRAIVEIGSYKGQSTCALARGALWGYNAHVWAIDPWDLPGNVTGRFGFADPSTRQAFNRQVELMGLGEQITAQRAFAVDAAREWQGPPVGLLYIDGDHAKASIVADFTAWERHLTPGATVVFDDLDTPRNPGVRRALEALNLEWEVRAERLAVVRWLPK